jgi:hypothetical protein
MQRKDLELYRDWEKVLDIIQASFGKRPGDLNSVLFLIGVQELGQGKKIFTKEEKRDLIHIAICKIMSLSGYYELEGIDKDGWPHWRLIKKLPYYDILEQEKLMKMHIIEYFKKEIGL